MSTSMGDTPDRLAAAIWRSISREGSAASRWVRVTRGRPPTAGGTSHSCEIPTSRPGPPIAATISVAAGRSETTRMPSGLPQADPVEQRAQHCEQEQGDEAGGGEAPERVVQADGVG